jgi:DNA-binding GntR family transcriptional regulator
MSPKELLERVSTVDALSRALRRRILEGDLKPGERLRETEVAEHYGVGRYTVRSAIQDLVYRGLAEHLPNKGASVLNPTPEIVHDVYAYRAALECEAARLVSEGHLSLQGPREALEHVKSLSADLPWSDVLESDLAFHQAIVDAAGSSRMSQAFRAIVDQALLCLSQSTNPQSGSVLEEHESLLEALESRDSDRAANALREHLYDIAAQMGAPRALSHSSPTPSSAFAP